MDSRTQSVFDRRQLIVVIVPPRSLFTVPPHDAPSSSSFPLPASPFPASLVPHSRASPVSSLVTVLKPSILVPFQFLLHLFSPCLPPRPLFLFQLLPFLLLSFLPLPLLQCHVTVLAKTRAMSISYRAVLASSLLFYGWCGWPIGLLNLISACSSI